MSYIGKQPARAALTSSDITDGIISTAKIADDAVGNTKLDLSANYAFTGTVTGVVNGDYTLKDIKDYTETDAYTTTSATNQFTCTDQSLNFTTSAQTNGADLICLHASLNAHSDAASNGYGLYLVHSTSSDFSSGTATTLQSGRYCEDLQSGSYKNKTGFARLTSLTANTTYYVRLFAMIQRPSSGTITLNQDAYATSAQVRHCVTMQQFVKN
jgi:hypothetical protein